MMNQSSDGSNERDTVSSMKTFSSTKKIEKEKGEKPLREGVAVDTILYPALSRYLRF